MKLQIIIGALLAMTIGSVSAAWADRGCDCRPGGPERIEGHRPAGKEPGQGKREHEKRDIDRITQALGLTETQKAKIEGIMQAERDKSAPLRQKLDDTWKQLRQAEQAAKFDEKEVRTIATNQAQLITEMTVVHVRTQNQIHSLLTPEQRAIAKKLRPPMEEHGPGHLPPPGEMNGPWCRPCCGCE